MNGPNLRPISISWRGKPLFDLTPWLESYFQGDHPIIDLPISGTPFQKAVLRAMQRIPFGERWSYGKLAEKAGYPKAARAVGSVCNKNPFPLLIPCHRVVGANSLGGFAYPLDFKRLILDFEHSPQERPRPIRQAAPVDHSHLSPDSRSESPALILSIA